MGYFNKFKHWLRVGYRNAVKRFGDNDAYEVGNFFTEIVTEAKRYSFGEFGETLKVKVWPQELKFTMKVVEPEYE